MIDHFTGRHRLARFASLLDDVGEWHCYCIAGAEFLKMLSLQVHRIRGSQAFQRSKLCLFVTICKFLIEAVCAVRIEGKDRIEAL